MEFVRTFDQLRKTDAAIAGGKGASLGEMTNAGIPVPEGFVILSDSFEQFLHETDLLQEIDAILESVDHTQIHTVEHASEKIQRLILEAQMPQDINASILENYKTLDSKFVAVRSSATAEDGAEHAWAGQLDSFLNTTEESLIQNVQKCWASLFTPRAIFYRFEKKLHSTKISVAVVVQKMVNSEVSGIAFSVHPVTEDHNQLIIEAGYGLGEAIVSGQITPDSYVVKKEPQEIIDINVSTQNKGLYRVDAGGPPSPKATDGGPNEWRDIEEIKGSLQKLTNVQIQELSDLIVKIENQYGFPCDIEWAYEAGKFYIVQSRPITTLSNKVQTVLAPAPTAIEYLLTYEGRGLKPLFYDFVSEGYLPEQSVVIYRDGLCSQFYDKTEIKKMEEIGKIFFQNKKTIEKVIIQFEKLVAKAGTLSNKNNIALKLSKKEVQESFHILFDIHREYAHFDFAYTDGAYEFSKTDAQIAATLQLVEKRKNIFREDYNKIFFSAEGLMVKTLQKIAIQFSVSVEDLEWYLQSDIYALFENCVLSNESIAQRKKFYAFYVPSSNKIKQFLQGTQAAAFIKQFGDPITQEVGETIKGITANKSDKSIKGNVYVLNADYGDIEKMRLQMANMPHGDILVAVTTAPEHMDAIRKASAIITDVGGMLSHTAIVSRELGIPSIVSTSFASKVLRNGDLVEVDTNTGIVKILKKEIVLVKSFSREHSLFYTYAWRDSNCFFGERWLDANVENVLYIRPKDQKVVDVWYGSHMFGTYDAAITSHYTRDPQWFSRAVTCFEEEWKILFSYVQKSEHLTREELIDFYKHWVLWWEPMAIMMEIPAILKLPENVRKKAYTLRSETQEYSAASDDIYLAYIRHTHSELSPYYSVLKPEEVFADSFPPKEELDKRLHGWFLTNKEFHNIEELDSVLKERHFMLEKNVLYKDELRGQTAFKGVVRGKVHLVIEKKDIANVKEGEIIVSHMTTPEFVTAMQKAVGIITDEGGITSHAAIIARELQKPCVIGTKIATQVLKDGDFVEVDADSGVVKILKMASLGA